MVNGALVEMPFGGNSDVAHSGVRCSIEINPHGYIHNAVGGYLKNAAGQPVDRNGNVVDLDRAIYGDMADLLMAAHDPIFHAHHGNIERLWELWRTPLSSTHGTNEPWNEAQFSSKEFLFFDVSSSAPFAIKVSQTRHTEDLGYQYAPPPSAPLTALVQQQQAQPAAANLSSRFVQSRATLRRPDNSLMAFEAIAPATHRVLLSLIGVYAGPGRSLDVAVYLTDKEGADVRPSDGAYAGLISAVKSGNRPTRGNFVLDVTDVIGRLKPKQDVGVMLVPLRTPGSGDQPLPAVERIELRVSG